MKEITALTNPLVKEVSALRQKKYRCQSGLFLIEGLRGVEEAVKSGLVTAVFIDEAGCFGTRVDELLTLAAERNVQLYSVTLQVMKKLCDTESPQGIVAVCRQKNVGLEALFAAGKEILLLDRVADPGNMGTLIRTADAAGFGGVIVLRDCADIYAPKVVRATMGSLLHLPLAVDVDIAEAVAWAADNDYELVVTSLEGGSSLYKTDLLTRTCVVIGNEAAGVSEQMLRAATKKVFIPMQGQAESLNAAVAGGIVMFECLRRRLAKSR